MRLIDADALINRIVFHSDLSFDQKEAFEDEINAEPTIELERDKEKWIPCSERLPEYGKTVLWCNDKGSIFTTAITYMNGTSWAVGKRHRRSQVVAWMPLPEPYGGDQNG